MPFALVTIGLLLIVTGARDTYAAFGTQLQSDFTGQGNFIYWLAALGFIGALGYIQDLRTFSRVFLTLVIISMLLSNQGFFAKLQSALGTAKASPAQATVTPSSTTSSAAPTNATVAAVAPYAADVAQAAPYISDLAIF
jgi:hypothetical protein